MTLPPCDHCLQPWAHGFDGPPVKRDVRRGKVIALAIVGGVATQIPVIMLAAFIYVGLTRPSILPPTSIRQVATGSLRPRLQACELFYRWQRTHQPNLLNRAVADAHSRRVPWQSKLRFRNDLGGLRSWTQDGTYARSPTAISFEHAVRADCAPIIADHRHVRRHHHRSARVN